MSAPIPVNLCPAYAPVLGTLGITFSLVFACAGAAYGTAKAGIGIIQVGILRPDLVMRSALPVIMAGIVGLYGVITDIVIITGIQGKDYSLYAGAMHMCAGLGTGLSGLASGIALGIVGDAGVRGVAQQPRLFVGMVLILIFAEVLGLYGVFLSIMMSQAGLKGMTCS